MPVALSLQLKTINMKTFITTIILFFSYSMYSQCPDEYISKMKYPGICVENIIRMYKMSRESWEKEMKTYRFIDQGIDEQGATYYSTGSLHSNEGIQLIVAKDFGLMKVENIPSTSKTLIFNSIISELEPFFKEKTKNWSYFEFKYTDGNVYQFAVLLSPTMDLIFLKKV